MIIQKISSEFQSLYRGVFGCLSLSLRCVQRVQRGFRGFIEAFQEDSEDFSGFFKRYRSVFGGRGSRDIISTLNFHCTFKCFSQTVPLYLRYLQLNEIVMSR